MAGLIAAMENADNVEVETNGVAAAQAETAAVQETTEALAEGEELSSEIDNVAVIGDDAEQLEQIGEVAQEAVESGEGLSEDAAAIATIAVERIHNRLFGAGRQRIVPAKESFGHTNTRMASTKMVIEGVSETIERIWKAIKAFAARIWEKIKLFLAKIFNSSKMMGKNIENLRDRIRKIPSEYVEKEKKLENTSLAKSISVGGKANAETFEKIAKHAEKLVDFAHNVGVSRVEINTVLVGAAGNPAGMDEAALKDLASKSGTVNASIVNTANQDFSDAKLTGDLIKNTGKTKNGETVSAYGPFVSNVALVVTTSDHDSMNITFSEITAKGNKVAEEVASLDRASLTKVLNRCEGINDKVQEFQKIESDAKKLTDDIEKLSDTVIATSKKIASKTGGSAETNRGLGEIKRSVNDSLAIINSITSKSPAILVQTVAAGVNYVSASIANFGPKSSSK